MPLNEYDFVNCAPFWLLGVINQLAGFVRPQPKEVDRRPCMKSVWFAKFRMA